MSTSGEGLRLGLMVEPNKDQTIVSDSPLSSGEISGIVIGVLVVIIGLCVLAFFVIRRRNQGINNRHQLLLERLNTIKLESKHAYFTLL